MCLSEFEKGIVGHSKKCERSRLPKNTCKCKCGGKYHGVAGRLEDFYNDPHGQIIDEDYGGELAKEIARITKHKYVCQFCETEIPTDTPQGYLHNSGLRDKDNKLWWLYYQCPDCEYNWSWWKFEKCRIKKKRKKKGKEV